MKKNVNFLFLFSDQHRGDWMPYPLEEKIRQGVADLDLRMPHLQAMMARGTTFTQAITPAPVCAPARACLAAGKRYKNCRVATNAVNYDPCLPTFYGKLHDAGYFVAGAGKFDLNKGDLDWGNGWEPHLSRLGFDAGLDCEGKMDTVWAAMKGAPGPYGTMLEEAGWLERHVADMSQRGCGDHPTDLPDALYADNWVTDQGIQMLERMPKDRSWFMQVNFSGPHDPWDITRQMKQSVAGRLFPDAAECPFIRENRKVRENYAAMLENLDRNIGRLLQVVEERGELDNTILVYASDHGEMMGDHGLYGKLKPGQGAIHIPMVIDASCLGAPSGILNGMPVELQDLTATFLDYAGIPLERSLESVSLRPVVEGNMERVRDVAISELIVPNRSGMISSFGTVTDGTYKLILRSNGETALFDLSQDPFEERDLAQALPQTVERLRTAFGSRGQQVNPVAAAYSRAFHIGA